MMRLGIALCFSSLCLLSPATLPHSAERRDGSSGVWARVAQDQGDTRDEKQGDGPPPVVPPTRPPKLRG